MRQSKFAALDSEFAVLSGDFDSYLLIFNLPRKVAIVAAQDYGLVGEESPYSCAIDCFADCATSDLNEM